MPSEVKHLLIKPDNLKCPVYFISEQALTILFPDISEEQKFRYVQTLFSHFACHPLPCQLDVIPAVGSLTIIFDLYRLMQECGVHYADKVLLILQQRVNEMNFGDLPKQGRKLRIPVCYEALYAPDIMQLAKLKNISCEEVIAAHSSVEYCVLMLGFLPGFAYMGYVPEQLRVSRHADPRRNVVPGSVGIAGRQTGIYPLHSPGGWFIIGRTPLQIFFPDREESPTLFLPGDEVTFYSITSEEFRNFPADLYNPVIS